MGLGPKQGRFSFRLPLEGTEPGRTVPGLWECPVLMEADGIAVVRPPRQAAAAFISVPVSPSLKQFAVGCFRSDRTAAEFISVLQKRRSCRTLPVCSDASSRFLQNHPARKSGGQYSGFVTQFTEKQQIPEQTGNKTVQPSIFAGLKLPVPSSEPEADQQARTTLHSGLICSLGRDPPSCIGWTSDGSSH